MSTMHADGSVWIEGLNLKIFGRIQDGFKTLIFNDERSLQTSKSIINKLNK